MLHYSSQYSYVFFLCVALKISIPFSFNAQGGIELFLLVSFFFFILLNNIYVLTVNNYTYNEVLVTGLAALINDAIMIVM